MTTRDRAPAGAPCWVDLATSNVATARRFYEQLFGWVSEDPAKEFGGYFNFRKDGVLVAGCMPKQNGASMEDVWTTYLATDDVMQTLREVRAHGGRVDVDAMVVGELGTMAVVADPGGSTVGVWEARAHAGFGRYAEVGTPRWFDLQTTRYDACLAFYRDAFSWTTRTLSDSPEFRYTTLKIGEEDLAGIMDGKRHLPQGAVSRWTVVFAVTETDAAVAQVVAFGGSVRIAAADSPYGRLATVVDPTGAVFALISGA